MSSAPRPPAPPPPPTDDKDWTWVLDRPCPECGFVAAEVPPHAVADLLRDNVESWHRILTSSDHTLLTTRPDTDHWSATEYAAHVRDVFRIYDERLGLMLQHDGPHFPNWDQNQTAIADRYDLADPARVAKELVAAGDRLADHFDAVEGDQWDRTGHRSDGAAFTVTSFARYFLHDPVHHLHDVERGLEALR